VKKGLINDSVDLVIVLVAGWMAVFLLAVYYVPQLEHVRDEVFGRPAESQDTESIKEDELGKPEVAQDLSDPQQSETAAPEVATSSLVYRRDLAELGEEPVWEELDQVGAHVTVEEFLADLERYFVVGDRWQEFITRSPAGLLLKTDPLSSRELCLSESSSRYWRPKAEITTRTVEQPLAGVRIAIDPGHIGGKCAKMEERWFQIDESLPVMEGEMVLMVAQLLKPQLEALGAEVKLTRSENAPVGIQRTPHFMALAQAKIESYGWPQDRQIEQAQKMFYRTAEIRARSRLVNEVFQPDMAVALHFNAEAWGDPSDPQLTENNHFHILVNGAYTSGEVAQHDQRYEMIKRILEGTIHEEIALAECFVEAFKQETQLPAYHYEPNSKRAIQVDDEGYVWARNLLANRLFQCPVVFLEPYVMNSAEVHARAQEGDYVGERMVAGKMRKSIFREYADAIVRALTEYYGPE